MTKRKILKKLTPLYFNSIVHSLIVLSMTSASLLYASTLQNNKANASGSAAKAFFRSTSVHVGLVKPGEEAQGEFIVENKGNADLVLKRVAPT